MGLIATKPRAELLALADVDQPRVILRAFVAESEQFLEHDGDLDPVGGAEAVELEWVLADRERAVVGRAGDRAVDGGEFAAAGLGPAPHGGGRIILVVGHAAFLSIGCE